MLFLGLNKFNWFIASFNFFQMLIILTKFKHVWACLFFRWCNQAKLLHHGLGWAGHHFFKHVQTRLMYDAIKQNYCITIFRDIWFFKKMMQSNKIIASIFGLWAWAGPPFDSLTWSCHARAYQSNKFEQHRVVANSLNLF